MSNNPPFIPQSRQRSVFKRCRLLLLLLLAGAVPALQAQANFGSIPVGTASGAQTVTVTAKAAGQVANVKVLTSGISGLDFAGGSGSCASANLSAGSTCTASVTFTPSVPGLRIGAVVLVNGSGVVLGTEFLSGTGQGGLGVLVPGNVIPVAGDGNWKLVLDGFAATSAELDLPSSVTLDGQGNLYIADSLHNRIRKVTASTGIISTIAGNGNPAYTGDNGPAVAATVNVPSGVTLDGAGNLYIADTGNNVVRVINGSTGIITTIAGTSALGSSGDGGPATSATLNQPWGVTLDTNGNVFVADTSNHRIRLVCAASGTVFGVSCPAAGDIVTVAGTGFTNPDGSGAFSGDGGAATSADLYFPYAVAFDANGSNMYIPDTLNNRVRIISSSGTINTFAGTGNVGFSGNGGPATSADLWAPSGVIADPANNIYIADTQNSAIRKVSSASGNISVVAQAGVGSSYYEGNLSGVSLYGPIGLFFDGHGNLYFADYFNQRVREIQANVAALDFTKTPVRQGEQSAPMSQTVENDGNATLDLSAITPDQNAAIDAGTTTCTATDQLSVDVQCTIGAIFAPSPNVPPTNPELGNIDVAGATVNTPLDIELIGDATAINSTTVTITSSVNPSGFGQSVTFTATVTTGPNTGSLTGAVTFFVDGVQIQGAPINVNASGAATFTTPSLAVGTHAITASYGGDNLHLASPLSATLSQVVLEGTSITLVSSQNPSAVGGSVTFTATITSSAGGGVVPDGVLTFLDGSTVLGTSPISSSGLATFTTSTLAQGLHSIAATYPGDTAKAIQGGVSNVVSQDVLEPSVVVLTSTPNPSYFGTTITFSVAVTASGTQPPTGAVKFFDGAAQIGTATLVGTTGLTTFTTSSLAIGTHSITANYAGDNNDGPGTSVPVSQVVNQAQTSTSVSATPNPGIAGGPEALTAAVTVTQGTSTPSGTVTFTSGSVTLGSAKLVSGTATISPVFAPGPEAIVATYSGDTDDAGSASTPLALTVQIATTSTVLASNANPSVVLASIVFSVKVTSNGGVPTGSVTFSADGNSIGVATLDGTGSASVTSTGLVVGSHAIVATYSGDTNNGPSTSATLTQVVNTIPTATALGASSTGGTAPQVILVSEVVGTSGPIPTGTVTFLAGGIVIGSATLDASGAATLNPNLQGGSYSIVASYGGDSLHAPSQSQPVTVSSVPIGYGITVTPPTVTVPRTQNATVTVSLAAVSGFADTIGLGCASLPAAVNCHFSNNSVALKAGTIQNVQLTIDTNNPLSGGDATSKNEQGSHSTTALAGFLLPVSALFGFIFWRFRKRNKAVFSVLLLLALSAGAILMNGCSGYSQSSASPGTYTIQVTGTGVNSDIIHYQNVTLTITQ
jgi:sugar lactone lactonase YvrE